MTAAPGDVVRLRRNLIARLLGGSRLHALLTVLLALDLVATVVAALAGAPAGLVVLPFSLAVLFLLSAFGFVAGASCEAEGVAWRYVARRAFRWSDVSAVHLTDARRALVGTATRPVIVLTVGRFDYQVTPAAGVSSERLDTFARRLAGFATARGVEVRVDGAHWADLGVGTPRSATRGGTP